MNKICFVFLIVLQVFGVLDAPEYSGVYRPVINEQDILHQTQAEIMQTSAEDLHDLNFSVSGDPESVQQVFVTMSIIKNTM